MADRQVLVELALFGEFRHVPELLWYREVAGAFSYARQRRMLFVRRPPLHTYTPAMVQHFAVLVWDLVVAGRARPRVPRATGMRYACLQLWHALQREWQRDDAEWRTALDRLGAGGSRDAESPSMLEQVNEQR
jgi:hypothetical protein